MLILNKKISRNVFHLRFVRRFVVAGLGTGFPFNKSLVYGKTKNKISDKPQQRLARSNDGTVDDRLVVSVSNEGGGNSPIGPKPRWYVKQKRLHTTTYECTYVFFFLTNVRRTRYCVCVFRTNSNGYRRSPLTIYHRRRRRHDCIVPLRRGTIMIAGPLGETRTDIGV